MGGVTLVLNENQVRRIVSTFVHVDDLLRSVIEATHLDGSPFARHRPDVTTDEARLLRSFVSSARARMLAALDHLGIPRPEQNLSARRSASTALLFAEISLSELDRGSMRGYGTLDEAAGAEVTALAADLQEIMRRGSALLREHESGGLAEQVAAVPGSAGEVLRRLLKLSTDHGLADLRPLIAAAADRASSTTFDVGVFGRVSAGKSSLINALVRSPVLPVGATPVTAVPVRIAQGIDRVEIRFADGRSVEAPITEIPTFATEEHNPQNRRGVRSIEVTLPSVPPGVRLLDTPGVGSLGTSGSAQAFAWLPRCDLGVVLVAAGTPLGRDETALISGLRHAGIECRVLLSKADLLDEGELEGARAYIASELRGLLGPGHGIDVRAISTLPTHASGLEGFRRDVLETLAAEHVARAGAALRARLLRLVRVAAAAIEGGDRSAPEKPPLALEKARAVAAEAIGKQTDQLAGSAARVLESAAEVLSEAWGGGEDGAAPARAAIVNAANHALAEVRESVDEARRSGAASDSDRRRVPPLFDPEFLDAMRSLPPPRFVPAFLRTESARRALAPIHPFLDEALARFATRLRYWGEGALRELQAAVADAGETSSSGLKDLEALVDEIDRERAAGDVHPSAQTVLGSR
jgi:GTP-binding protein EngB required for normal cell division